jgi:uncharacterized membrane protein HdeD (DUF308 family)
MPQIADPADPASPGDRAKVRSAYRRLILAGVIEMALGLFYAVFTFAGHGIFHVVAGIVIIAGGLYIISIALRLRRKARAADRIG